MMLWWDLWFSQTGSQFLRLMLIRMKYPLPDVSNLYLSLEFSFCKLSLTVPQDMFKTII